MCKKNFFVSLGVGVLLILGVFYGFHTKSSLDTNTQFVTVRFGYLPIVWNLPLYMAVEKGYFTEAKITPDLVQFQSPNQMIDAIMAGQLDFTAPGGPLGIPAIADYKDPGKMKIYAISGEESQDAIGVDIIVPTNSNINSLKQLKGKKFGIPAGTIQWRTIAREILAQNGLDMDKDLTVIELAPNIQVQAIASGQVDAMLALEPIPTVAVSKGVAKILIKAPDKFIADPMWVGAGVVSTKFIKDNSKLADAVITILNQSLEEVNADFDSSRQYLPKYTSLTADIVSSVPRIDYKIYKQIDQKTKESIKKFLDIFYKYKVVDGALDINNLLYSK